VRIVRGSRSLEKPLERSVLTVGNFDGLHLGHRRIMATVTGRARAFGGEAAVYTFEPHPRKVLRPDRAPRLLTTLEQKLELFDAAGVDVAIVESFDREFAKLPAERFVREVLFERIAPLEVYVGYDFRYGRDREGSMRTLTELGPHLGFAVTIVPELKLGSRDVNSTRIRELLEQGNVSEAALLLGRPYTIRGQVVAGQRRGRTLGFPTLNLAAENEVLPEAGVYEFALLSDDGSVLRIADTTVIDHDGPHSARAKTGAVALGAGLHPFELAFFQGAGDRALDLRMRTGEQDWAPVPAEWLYRRR